MEASGFSEMSRLRAWGIGGAVAVTVVGLVLAAVFWLWGTAEQGGAIDDLQRFEVPGMGRVTLDRGRYTLYHEYEDAGRCTRINDVASRCSTCQLESVTLRGSETEPDVVLHDDESGQSYSSGPYSTGPDDDRRHDGVACSTFTIEDPGEYTLSARGGPGTAAVGPDLADRRGRWSLRTQVALLPTVAWGLAGLVWLLIRHRRSASGPT